MYLEKLSEFRTQYGLLVTLLMVELFIEIKHEIAVITVILNKCDNKKTFFRYKINGATNEKGSEVESGEMAGRAGLCCFGNIRYNGKSECDDL